MDAIKEFLKPEIIWFLVGLALLIMEFMLPGLIIAFFGVGACIVGIVCLITDISVEVQLLIFIIASALSLLCLRSWLKGIFMGHVKGRQDMMEDLQEFVGERAVVMEKISPKAGGKVEIHGTNWTAEADAEIPAGTAVEVIGKENLTLRVKAL